MLAGVGQRILGVRRPLLRSGPENLDRIAARLEHLDLDIDQIQKFVGPLEDRIEVSRRVTPGNAGLEESLGEMFTLLDVGRDDLAEHVGQPGHLLVRGQCGYGLLVLGIDAQHAPRSAGLSGRVDAIDRGRNRLLPVYETSPELRDERGAFLHHDAFLCRNVQEAVVVPPAHDADAAGGATGDGPGVRAAEVERLVPDELLAVSGCRINVELTLRGVHRPAVHRPDGALDCIGADIGESLANSVTDLAEQDHQVPLLVDTRMPGHHWGTDSSSSSDRYTRRCGIRSAAAACRSSSSSSENAPRRKDSRCRTPINSPSGVIRGVAIADFVSSRDVR